MGAANAGVADTVDTRKGYRQRFRQKDGTGGCRIPDAGFPDAGSDAGYRMPDRHQQSRTNYRPRPSPLAPLASGIRSPYALPVPDLHLLDGTYELFRSHFGAPPRGAPDGTPIGAVHGIMASTLSLLSEV